MHRLLLLVLISGCEQIEPSGHPLQPVQVAADAPTAVPVHVIDAPAVADQEEEEAFSLSSEEMAPGGQADAADTVSEGALAAADSAPPVSVPDEVASPEPPPVTAAAAAAIGWPQQVGKAWPVRLVTTVPNASPPRAILGLPDGKEIVVNPGSMVPDFGLVVVAISPGAAELAKIAPAGDHATIESVTLRAQY